MTKKYTICSTSISKITPRAILSIFIGLAMILGGLLGNELVWWSRTLIGLVGFLLGSQGYYDIKYIKGLKENGFLVEENSESIVYYNEFEGNKTIYPKDFSNLKIYKKNREIYLLELKYENSKKQENINVSGLYSDDIDELIQYIKKFNNRISVSRNN